MISLLIGLAVLILVIKMIKSEKRLPPSAYDEMPDNKKMTFEEWDALFHYDKAPAHKAEEKISKDEYEAESLLRNNCL